MAVFSQWEKPPLRKRSAGMRTRAVRKMLPIGNPRAARKSRKRDLNLTGGLIPVRDAAATKIQI